MLLGFIRIMSYMSRIANNALLGGGVKVRVWIRGQRKIKGRSKALVNLCWPSWTSLNYVIETVLLDVLELCHRDCAVRRIRIMS